MTAIAKTWRSTVLLLFVLFLVGCGRSEAVSRDDAVSLVTAKTPMQVVVEAQFFPNKWVVYGEDSQGRTLAVWVGREVEDHIYLDTGVARTQAVTIAEEQGLVGIDPNPILMGPSRPRWYVSAKEPSGKARSLVIDFQTGEIIQE
jgi:uncharacterized protein YpmB